MRYSKWYRYINVLDFHGDPLRCVFSEAQYIHEETNTQVNSPNAQQPMNREPESTVRQSGNSTQS